MTFPRQFLLGVVALGLQVGIASAAEPGPDTVQPPTALSLPVPPDQTFTATQVPCPASPCCDGGLDCGTARCGGLLGGVGLYLVQPYFENNPAFLTVRTSRTNGFTRSDDHVAINHDLEVAPLVWLGYLSESGLGGRGRYWYFREGSNQTLSSPQRAVSAAPLGLPLFANPGQNLNVTSKLEVQVADLEGLQDLRAGHWDFLLSAGVRLGRVSQSYHAFVAPDRGTVTALSSGHSFQGAGPVLAAEARRPLGDCGLALYGSGRGSVLFGSAHQNAAVSSQNNVGSDHRDRGLLIGELELGLEYGRNVCQSRLFGQVAVVGQNWFGAGSASRSTLQVAPGGDFTGGSYAVDSDVAFLGVSFRIGITY